VALLLGVTLAAYAPALRGGFIWDDDLFVANNADLKTLRGLGHIWTEPFENPQYSPVLLTAFWLQFRCWGLNASGYHLVSVLLHGLNAVLLWRAASELRLRGAFLAGLLLALHPVHVESVAWISETKNTLSGFFYLAALWCWARWRLAPASDARPAIKRSERLYASALGLFVLALLSKATTVSLPLALLCLEAWRNRRVPGAALARLLPFALLAIVPGALALAVEAGRRVADYRPDLLAESIAAARSVWFYLGKFLWPARLVAVYPRGSGELSGANAAMLLSVPALLLALWAARARWGHGPFLCALFHTLTLLPIPFMGIGFVAHHAWVADHFFYLPSLGATMLFAAGLSRIRERIGPRGSWVAWALPIGLAILTWKQSSLYADPQRLWRHTLRENPACYVARRGLARLLLEQGDLPGAAREFETLASFHASDAPAHADLGAVLHRLGRPAEAESRFRRALSLDPSEVEAAHNLVATLAAQERGGEALTEAERFAARSPAGDPDAAALVARALLALDRQTEAADLLARTLRDHPAHAGITYLLARARHAAGRRLEAVELARKALSRDPSMADAHNLLGVLLAESGQPAESAKHFAEAVRLDPGAGEAYENLGILAYEEGRFAEAEHWLGEACRRMPANPETRRKLLQAQERARGGPL
jgi:Flp pilus assembly protein TadD